MDNKDFIERAILINGDKYDYSLSNYIKSSIKVTIKCNKCKYVFNQTPNNHLSKKHQCPSCNGKVKFTKNKILERFSLKHGYQYDYTYFGEYLDRFQVIDIICKKCNDCFKQTINDHLKSGCSNCAGNKPLSAEIILTRFNIVHGDLYDYDMSNYINVKSKITVKCKKHGDFKVAVRHLLNGVGCSRCKSSSGELKISKLLVSLDIEFKEQHIFDSCRNIRPLRFDFWLPDYNLCIEYDGVQHFSDCKFFGGIDSYNKRLKNDEIKDNWCNEKGIRLLRIKYNDDIEMIKKFL
jgi:very-short-patch-repair endonuclease